MAPKDKLDLDSFITIVIACSFLKYQILYFIFLNSLIDINIVHNLIKYFKITCSPSFIKVNMFPRSLFQGKVLGFFFFFVKEKRLKFVYKDEEERERERERLLINYMEY